MPLTISGDINLKSVIIGSTAATDPFYNNVVFLSHFEGLNGSTSIIDNSQYNVVPTVTGTAAISTTQFKYGTSSWHGANLSYFQINLGGNGVMTGDFTWETWLFFGTAEVIFYDTINGGYLYNNAFQSYGGPSLPINTLTPSGLWHHIAISRVGTTMRSFTDGVLQGTVTYAGTVSFQNCRYGTYVPNNNLFFTSYIDELRITKGVGRYTGNFTPPTAPFPNS